MSTRARWLVGIGSALLILAVYLLTMAPALTWAHHGADGGDLVAAVARHSIPHPPGFPTYLLLGELFIRLPWGEPASRMNLLSAILAAGAAGLLAAAVGTLLPSEIARRPRLALPVSLAAGLALGLAPLLWSQALITEVYAPAAFFTALVLFLGVGQKPAWAVGLAWGVGLGVHPLLALLLPVVLAIVWGERRGRAWRLGQAGLAAALCWGALYGPVLLARTAPSPWGNLQSLAGWWDLVSGRLYRHYLFALPMAAWPPRLLAWAGLLMRQFTPLGAVLAGLGWWSWWRGRRTLAVASAGTLVLFSLYALGYNTSDSLVYLAPALPVAALWLGTGLVQAAGWLHRRRPRFVLAVLLLPLLQGVLFWGAMDLRHDRQALAWVETILQEAPAQAILLTEEDAHTFALWYARDVSGQRPDVTVVDVDLWAQEAYREMLAAELRGDDMGAMGPAEEAARRTGRPLYRVGGELGNLP